MNGYTPASHPIVYEWLEHLARNGAVHAVSRTRWTGQRHETDTYRYARSIPLRDADDALRVNGCELTTDDGGKVLYHHAFATSLALDDHHVVAVIAAAGKSRTRTP